MTAALRVEKLLKNTASCSPSTARSRSSRGRVLRPARPNGAGKTTTVEILEGLNEPTGGSVEVLGMRGRATSVRCASGSASPFRRRTFPTG